MTVLAQEAGRIEAVFGAFEDRALLLILAISILALVVAYVLMRGVRAPPEGTERMRTPAGATGGGGGPSPNRQFRTVGLFLLILVVVLYFALPAESTAQNSEVAIRLGRSIAFFLGAAFSAITGFAGMWLAVRGNVRVANAAREEGLRRALTIAFRAGGVAGMFTVGLGLLGATAVLLIYKADAAQVLVGFGFGGALLAMFMRVGGGIFTKAADVGADLVGKVEQGIPEDDPRNAAVIADNVGDNVGDCAGMAADLFESYEVTLVASIILGAAAYAESPEGAIVGVMFPLLVRAVGVVTSVIGIYSVRPRSETEHGMRAINRGFFISALISAVAVYFVADLYVDDLRVFWAVVIGLVIAVTVVSAFLLGDSTAEALYFISLVGMGMLTTVGVIVSMDTYGPVADNAQGIAEMSGEFEGHPAEILQGLDAVGNSTKAITKGIAIATAVIAATSLFGSFEEALRAAGFDFTGVNVAEPEVLVGLLIGGAIPFLFSSLAIRAVGRAAARVVVEVRNQFRDHPGIMQGTETPDYGRVVDICTRTSLRELLTPGLLAVLAPIFVGFALEAEALGAYLAGAILTGQLLAVMLSNAGGAWDNAKKLVEEGLYGGKGSESHKATVIGDTVGDPFKDTAGPALNPLIKVMNLVALLIAPLVVTNVDNIATRTVVSVVGVLILAATIWNSKRQKADELVSGEPPSPEADAIMTEAG